MQIESSGIDVEALYDRRASHRWERTCVGDVFERVTWSRPDATALVAAPGAATEADRERLTYRQADTLVNQLANGLLSRGLSRGDRVLLLCENSVESFLTKIAIAKAGLVAVPLNPSMATDVIRHAIRLTEPEFAVLDAELWPRVAVAFEAESLTPGIMLAFGPKEEGPLGTARGSVWFDEFIDGGDPSEPEVEVHGDDIWQMLFTSGTTSWPKASMTSHLNTHMAAYTYALSLTRGLVRESDLRLCTFLPIIYHVAGDAFTFPAMLAGGALVLGRRPDPMLLARTLTRESVTALWGGAPTMLQALVEALDESSTGTSARTLQVLAHGWGSLPPSLAAALRQVTNSSLRMFTIFGQTEAVSSARFWAHRDSETFTAHCPASNYIGRPNPLLAERIVDPEGETVTEPGVAGEAVLRSPVVTAGYYHDPDATAEAFRGGWFHSGDSCVYDEDGLMIMVDRIKDIVKTGGENVSSQRVEAVLLEHPDVERAAVIGLPHLRWGEAVTALVILRPSAAATEETLIAHCRRTLAGFEMPKGVVFVEEFPETVGAKILKYQLRNKYQDLYHDVNAGNGGTLVNETRANGGTGG